MPWKKGQSGNPHGRPPKTTEPYPNILTTRVTLNDFARIIDKAVEQAKVGNHAARKWIGDYLLGKPGQFIETDVEHSGEVIVRIIEETVPYPSDNDNEDDED